MSAAIKRVSIGAKFDIRAQAANEISRLEFP
jgi:hypothetical protein